MKRIWQKIEIPQNKLTQNVRLRSDYAKVKGVIFELKKSSITLANFIQIFASDFTCSLRIGGKEILPVGTNVSLFLQSPLHSRKDTMLVLTDEDGIEANNQNVEVTITDNDNILSSGDVVNLYVLLSN